MDVNDQNEQVETEKKNKLAIAPTTLATIESLTFPLVQEVVVSADIRCKNCQDRVANIVSRLNGKCHPHIHLWRFFDYNLYVILLLKS
ncbi:hypothetical protein HanOQP8_Chr17g0680271 [Helianthus annuus]|nr:hypothetical protein HanOQP8_Chr17g0680271 [Helianthus annuus]KAJ0815179.1 hypothetical protein HanPSC8_Chr17g0794581 [Helianthus annuus]